MSDMSEPRTTLLIRVSASLKSRLADMAKQERRSLSKQVELLLERCLAVIEKRVRRRDQDKVGRRRK
jgi:hypothetical protein